MASKKMQSVALYLEANQFLQVQEMMRQKAEACRKEYERLKKEADGLNAAIAKGDADEKRMKSLQSQLALAEKLSKQAKAQANMWEESSKQQAVAVDRLSKVMQRQGTVWKSSGNEVVAALRLARKELMNFGNDNNVAKMSKALEGSKMTVQEYQLALRRLQTEGEARLKELAAGFDDVVSAAKTMGAGSVEEGRRMMEALQAVRGATNESSLGAEAYKKRMAEIDEAINRVANDMARMGVNMTDVNKALEATSKGGKNGGWLFDRNKLQASEIELNRIRTSLLAYQKTLSETGKGGSAEMDRVRVALAGVEGKLRTVTISSERFEEILRNPSNASMSELKKVIEELEIKYQSLNKNSKEYNETVLRLRNAKHQLKEYNEAVAAHATAWEKAVSRLKTYIGVYIGFNQLLTWTRQAIGNVMKLSDALSDIQKRTRLSDPAIKEISQTLDSFDTRTSQEQLHQLAATAGLLGLKAKDDIIGFTKAADQMSVALVELGSEGAAQLMKIATLTGDVKKFGVEEALVKTGSAINELTAASAASAGPIVNFISRMGAVGSQAHLTMGDLAGIGATLDALGQPIELSATAMNRFIMALQGNHKGLAASLGIDIQELSNLVKAGETMEAMLLVLEKMGEQEGGVAALGMIFDEIGSEGTRLKQTMASLIGNVDFLKTQVDLSNKAFDEGVSVLNEYNIKNENAAAIMQRTGNMIVEYFSNSDVVDFWRGVAKAINNIVAVLLKVGPAVKYIIGMWMGWKTAIALTSVEFSKLREKSKLFFENFGLGIRVLITQFKNVTTGVYGFGKALNVAKTALTNLNWVNPLVGLGGAALGIITSHLLPKYLTQLGQAKDDLAEVKDATERWTEAWNRYHAATDAEDEKSQKLKEDIAYLDSLQKGTDAYERARRRLLDTYSEELKAIASEVTHLRNVKDYRDELIAVIQKENKEANASQMVDKLMKAEEAAQNATAALQSLSKGSEEYNEAAGRAVEATEKWHAAQNTVQNAIGDANAKLASQISTLQNTKLAWDMLTRSIQENAKAQAKEQALTSEREARSQIVSNFRKQAVSIMTKGGKVTEDRAHEITNNLLDYILSDEANKELSWAQKFWIDRWGETLNYQSQSVSGASTWETAEYNPLENLVKEYNKKVQQSLRNEAKIVKWQSRNRQEGGLEADFMKSGWDKTSLEHEIREQLDKRSELLRIVWDKYNNSGDMASLNEAIGMNFGTNEEARDWVEKTTKQMKAIAKNQGWTLAGNWVWPKEKKETDGRNKHIKELNDEMNGMLDRLKQYYIDRKAIIDRARANELISEQEKDRQTMELEKQQNEAEMNLRREFVATNEKEFKNLSIDLVKTIYGDDKKATSDLNKIRNLMARFGKTMLDEISRKASENDLAIAKIQAKNRKALEDAVREYDTIGSAVYSFGENLDKTGLLTAGMMLDDLDKNEEAMNQFMGEYSNRLRFLFEQMGDAYSLNSEELVKRMRENGFNEWADEMMDPEKAELLLNKLLDFFNSYEDAIRKEANKIKKRIEMEYNDIDQYTGKSQKQLDDDRMRERERRNKTIGQGMGISYFGDMERWSGTNPADDAELEMIKLKIELQERYIATIQEREAAEVAAAENYEEIVNIQKKYDMLRMDSLEKLTELQREQSDLIVEDALELVTKLTPYADALNQFVDSFSSNIFGRKEDRQQAAKELLLNVTKTTAEMLRKWLIYIATKKVLDRMEAASVKKKDAEIQASAIQTATTEMTIAGITTTAQLTADQAQGIGKEVAKRGLIGLAIGAAITVAISALMGLVTSAVNKAKSQISSIGGGKLTTGMLTYAEGKYPVLGSDGQTYDAKYEGKPKTGVYKGGARFGIFSEKKPEAIIDGDTTQRILLNYPEIWRSILTIQKHGRLKEAYSVPTHAMGNLQDFQVQVPEVEPASDTAGLMNEQTLMALNQSISELNAQLAAGIGVRMRGRDGLDESTAKYNRFKKRNHITT